MAQSCPASPGDGLRSASPLSTAAGPWHVGRRSAGPCGSGAEHSISAQQAQTSWDRGLLSPPFHPGRDPRRVLHSFEGAEGTAHLGQELLLHRDVPHVQRSDEMHGEEELRCTWEQETQLWLCPIHPALQQEHTPQTPHASTEKSVGMQAPLHWPSGSPVATTTTRR